MATQALQWDLFHEGQEAARREAAQEGFGLSSYRRQRQKAPNPE